MNTPDSFLSNMLAASTGSLTSAPSMYSMSAMSSTFSSSTCVTLWVSDWITTSIATYVLTNFFLFALGILNRFLGALKSQLEMKWKAQCDTSHII
ncbi:hypothetical protein NX059_008623 [Plenodomus lindquistii]|nr:hypothetical protein NX059_008623 [Plenodomus lindquistii]